MNNSVLQVINNFNKKNNFDGIFFSDGDCSCVNDDLSPGNCLNEKCTPGKLGKCKLCGETYMFSVDVENLLCNECQFEINEMVRLGCEELKEEKYLNLLAPENPYSDISPPPVLEIISNYIEENNFDGLYTDMCHCFKGDLSPDNCFNDACKVGHKYICKNCQNEFISSKEEDNELSTTFCRDCIEILEGEEAKNEPENFIREENTNNN